MSNRKQERFLFIILLKIKVFVSVNLEVDPLTNSLFEHLFSHDVSLDQKKFIIQLTDFPRFFTLSFLDVIKSNNLLYSSFSMLLNVCTTPDFVSTSKSNDLYTVLQTKLNSSASKSKINKTVTSDW